MCDFNGADRPEFDAIMAHLPPQAADAWQRSLRDGKVHRADGLWLSRGEQLEEVRLSGDMALVMGGFVGQRRGFRNGKELVERWVEADEMADLTA